MQEKNKDYIYIYDDKGRKETMELVYVFKIEKNKCTYIVYKKLSKKIPLYVAKLEKKVGMMKINTNLSDEEIEMASEIIKSSLVEDENEIF